MTDNGTDSTADRPTPDIPRAEPEKTQTYAQEQSDFPTAAAQDSVVGVELQPGGVKAAVEAVLAVVDTPVTVRDLSAALTVSEARVEAALDELYRDYSGFDDGEKIHEPRGFELRRIAGGWRLYSRADFSPWVGRFLVGKTTAKLPRAAMETLTIVAYRQPVTKSHVAHIRGVSADSSFRTLLTRGLIAETDPDPETGARRYATTDLFLEKLGLDSIDQLPPLAPYLPDTDDIELAGETP